MAELMRRYVVMTLAADTPFDLVDPDAPFVLKPWKDPAALEALRVYRDNCYAELSRDLDEWIRAIEAGPLVRGDVGRRNEPHVGRAVKTRTARPARERAARSSRAKAGARPRRKAAAKKSKKRRR